MRELAIADSGIRKPQPGFPSVRLSLHPSARCRLKRGIDIIGAVVGLSILAAIALPVSIAILIDSPGPILYSQRRAGAGGRPFRMWKFRSMVPNADRLKHQVANQATGHIFKNENDPRITRVGRFLRRTSLDEFPQFLNVFRGEMSLVGTRPPTLDEIQHYNLHHWQRLCVKPGLTGEWQVRGRSSIKDFEKIVALDLEYQQKWSFAYDLKIILQTIAILLSKRSSAC